MNLQVNSEKTHVQIQLKEKKCVEQFLYLEKLIKKVPLAEHTKKKSLQRLFKEKSGWFACLNNSNVETSLLPDYFDNKQLTNILLKTETENYGRMFALLCGLTRDNSYQECLGYISDWENNRTTGIDLFSNSDEISFSSEILALKPFFEKVNDELKEKGYQDLVADFYVFYALHRHFKYSFAANKYGILFLNALLSRKFPNIAKLLRIESYMFEHCNKESRSETFAIEQYFDFLQDECRHISSVFRHSFREEIGYTNCCLEQKVAVNYVFDKAFHTGAVKQDHPAFDLYNRVTERGFLHLPLQTATENNEQISGLENSGLLSVFRNQFDVLLCIKPIANTDSVLLPYDTLSKELNAFRYRLPEKPTAGEVKPISERQNGISERNDFNEIIEKKRAFLG